MKKILFFLLSAFVGFAQSQTVTSAASDAAFGRLMSTVVGAGQETISFSSTGTPLLTPSAATLSSDGSASLLASRTGSITNSGGVPVTVTAVGKTAVSKFAPVVLKALAVVPALSAGVALYDLAKELGFTLNNSSGTLSVIQAGAVDYRLYNVGQPAAQSCNQFLGSVYSGYKPGACRLGQEVGGTTGLVYWYGATFLLGGFGLSSTVQGPDTVSTSQAVADAIAAKSGWPVSSNISKAVAQALPLTGDVVAPDSIAVTGPASSPVSTTTTTNSDGTKSIATTTAAHTYSGPNVSTVNNTTVNNYNTSNVVTSTSTVSSTPAAKSVAADPAKTDCQLYPDNAACAKFGTPENPVLPKGDSGFSGITPVSFSTVTGCPADLVIPFMGRSISLSYAKACSTLNDYVKPLVLILSAFAATVIFVGSFKV